MTVFAALLRRKPWLIDVGPVVFVVLAITVKLLYFSFAGEVSMDFLHNRRWLKRTALASIGSFGSLLLLFSPLLVVSRKRRLAVLWLVSFALTVLIFADVLYIRYFGDVLSVSAVSATRQVAMISDSIIALAKPADVLFFADLVLLPLFFRARSGHPAAEVAERRDLRRAGGLLLAFGAVLTTIPAVTILRAGEADYLKLQGVRRIGLLNYHFYDVARHVYVQANSSPVGPEDRDRVRAYLEQASHSQQHQSELFGIVRNRNLILVMVEALQSFPLDLVIDGVQVTPNLNAFARQSLAFTNFYDQTWHGVTSDGEFAALQSLHPLREGGVPTRHGANRFFALPSVLRENGYTTLSAHGFSGAIWMMATIHRSFGFDTSYFREQFRQTERIGMGLSDDSFFRQMLPRLERQREPFMAYLVTLSTHYPYRLPAGYREPRVAVPAGTLLAAYLQSVHHFDGAFGDFVAGLERSGLLDRSVIVLFGDHRAALGGPSDLSSLLSRFADYPQRASGFDHRYWAAEKRLPLMIRLPGAAAAGVRSGSAGQVDIAPTILSLLGVSEPQMVTLGRDLTLGGNSLVVFRDGGFVRGDTMCVVPSALVPSTQCRQLSTGTVIDADELGSLFAEARTRLQISDIILAGDLIPWASTIGGHRGDGRASAR